VRLPVGQRDGEVVGPGEAEAFAQEAEVPATVATAADAEAVDEVEGAGDGGGERGRPGPRRGGGLRGRRVLAVVGGVVADVLGRVAAVEPAEAAPGGAGAAAARARRRRRGVLRGVGRAHRRRPQLMGALEDAGGEDRGESAESESSAWGRGETASGWDYFWFVAAAGAFGFFGG